MAKKRQKRSLVNIITRVVLFTIIALLGVALFASVYFYINKEEISRKLVLEINSLKAGEISFEDIAFHPLVHFPQVSLQLH